MKTAIIFAIVSITAHLIRTRNAEYSRSFKRSYSCFHSLQTYLWIVPSSRRHHMSFVSYMSTWWHFPPFKIFHSLPVGLLSDIPKIIWWIWKVVPNVPGANHRNQFRNSVKQMQQFAESMKFENSSKVENIDCR